MRQGHTTTLAERFMQWAEKLQSPDSATWWQALEAEFAYLNPEDRLGFAFGAFRTMAELKLVSSGLSDMIRFLAAPLLTLWGIIQLYAVTVVINPELPINIIANKNPRFLPSDLQMNWQWLCLIFAGGLFIAAGAALWGRRDEWARHAAVLMAALLCVKTVAAIVLSVPGTIHLSLSLNLLILELPIWCLMGLFIIIATPSARPAA